MLEGGGKKKLKKEINPQKTTGLKETDLGGKTTRFDEVRSGLSPSRGGKKKRKKKKPLQNPLLTFLQVIEISTLPRWKYHRSQPLLCSFRQSCRHAEPKTTKHSILEFRI